ncbi:MAG: amidohydrolase family protein [Pseudomonadota bacterium]
MPQTPITQTISRRQLLSMLATSSAALTLTACDNPSNQRYNQADIDLLQQQRDAEALQAGKGPYGVRRYQGYRGLAKLPWFELDENDHLVCVDDSIPMGIDIHCHLGMSVLFSPRIDLNQSSPRVKHLLDCDGSTPGCSLDLDVYANGNFSLEMERELQKQVRNQALFGSDFAATQTIPNLLREMDAMRIEQAVLLPIKLGVWIGDDLNTQWTGAVDRAAVGSRLQVGGSVHPESDNAVAQLREQAAGGANVFKLHPTVQRFYPDHPKVMSVYEAAQELGVAIFFHGGRAGIEPESSHPFAMPRHYEAAIANFPKLPFIIGHAGARDFDAMLKLAVSYENTWLGIHGQSLTNLETMIRRTGGERMLFGSDWPFYHIGMSLAKVLIATNQPARRGLRNAILRSNAQTLLE